MESVSAGSIEIEVPYDGNEHVTRETLEDVRRWTAHSSYPNNNADKRVITAQIGHLVVTEHDGTDLAGRTGRPGRTMAIPLCIPVRSADLRSDDALVGDQYTMSQIIEYSPSPSRPKLVPVRLNVDVTDPGSIEYPGFNLSRAIGLSEQIMTFRSYLQLDIQVRVTLPERKDWNPPAPVVRRMRLALPSGRTLALSSVKVDLVDGTDIRQPDIRRVPPLVQQDPETAGIEWFDIPTRADDDQSDNGPKRFQSPLIRVRIHQPGELFSEHELLVLAEVEADEALLSGAMVRMFDARGSRLRGPRSPLKVRSSVTTEVILRLDDAFAKRRFWPQQIFHFDEVIPEQARLHDIKSALADLRFEVRSEDRSPTSKKAKSQELVALIEATRGDEEEAIQLLLVVLGRQHRTQRQSQHPGGRKYTSKLNTGDLTLVIYGKAPRDCSQLIHDVNALQLSLRDRFLKARR